MTLAPGLLPTQVEVTVVDIEGRVWSGSPRLAQLLGVEVGDLFGHSVFELVHPEDLQRAWAAFVDAQSQSEPVAPIDLQVRSRDGGWCRVEAVAMQLIDGSGAARVVVTTTPHDAARPRYELLVEQSPDAIAVLTTEGMIAYANAAANELVIGRNSEELVGRSVGDFVNGDTAKLFASMTRAADTGQAEPLPDFELHRADGTSVRVEGVVLPTTHAGAAALQLVLRDVTERSRTEAELMHAALHDPLTGLANRRLLTDRIAHAQARAKRSGNGIGLLFVDIDHFKRVNDEHGHAVGDLVLRELAGRLRGALRPGDTVARYGGDEFVVVCEDLTNGGILAGVAERIHAAVSLPIVVHGSEIAVGFSIGIAADDGVGTDELLERADRAMYEAKEQGRDD
jgi:diguanylate cyclase (GGDEF)-like protein/PAS domain S-box-containing protein